MENEIVWKRLIYHGKDLGDFYEVSNHGELRGVKTGKIRKKNITDVGYYCVVVSLGSRESKKMLKIHRAVAETFLRNPENYPFVNHIDGDKLNNTIDNLEWCTHEQNMKHAKETGLLIHNIGEQNAQAKLYEEDVRYIRNSRRGTKELAKMFSVNKNTVWEIKTNRAWKAVK